MKFTVIPIEESVPYEGKKLLKSSFGFYIKDDEGHDWVVQSSSYYSSKSDVCLALARFFQSMDSDENFFESISN